MKRLSMFNDGLCQCGAATADGLADSEGLWCQPHGRIRAVLQFEAAAFDLLRTYPDELPQAFAAVLRHREGRFDLVSDDLANLQERTAR